MEVSTRPSGSLTLEINPTVSTRISILLPLVLASALVRGFGLRFC